MGNYEMTTLTYLQYIPKYMIYDGINHIKVLLLYYIVQTYSILWIMIFDNSL